MRITVDLSDELLRRAEKKATDEGVPLREIVETALRVYLSDKPKGAGYTLTWTPDRGKLLPGVDLDDRDTLFDIMNGSK